MNRHFTLIELMIVIAIIAIIAAIAIPNLVAARKHGNEASAIGSLRTIVSSQAIFKERSTGNVFGALSDLGNAGLIDDRLSSGLKQGYTFGVIPDTNNPEYLFTAFAEPAIPQNTGDRSFFVDQTGVIRFSIDPLVLADVNSTPIGSK